MTFKAIVLIFLIILVLRIQCYPGYRGNHYDYYESMYTRHPENQYYHKKSDRYYHRVVSPYVRHHKRFDPSYEGSDDYDDGEPPGAENYNEDIGAGNQVGVRVSKSQEKAKDARAKSGTKSYMSQLGMN